MNQLINFFKCPSGLLQRDLKRYTGYKERNNSNGLLNANCV